MKNEEKYLPVGTVCSLVNSKKKLVVTGFYVIEQTSNKIFDYSGCIYPEGIIDPQKVILFNHDQIVEILHMGYKNEEEKEFKDKLKQYIIQKQEK